MSWTWSYHREDGTSAPVEGGPGAAPPVSPEFPNQSDAESWLGETWRELADAGVGAVSLLDGERAVYGPMSLHPAD